MKAYTDLLFLTFNFTWKQTNYQCCKLQVHGGATQSYVYMYHSSQNSPPIQAAKSHWGEIHVLYSWSLMVIL